MKARQEVTAVAAAERGSGLTQSNWDFVLSLDYEVAKNLLKDFLAVIESADNMADWLDEIEAKNRPIQEAAAARQAKEKAELKQRVEANRNFIASVRPVLEPMYQKLEVLIDRANAQQIKLEMRRVDSSANLSLHIYRISERSYRLVADSMVHLDPYPQGLYIWFYRGQIEIEDRKSGIPRETLKSGRSYSWSGWVPYSSLSDTDLSNIIKWLALGELRAPHFHNVITKKSSPQETGWWARLFK